MLHQLGCGLKVTRIAQHPGIVGPFVSNQISRRQIVAHHDSVLCDAMLPAWLCCNRFLDLNMPMKADAIVYPTSSGLYCAPGGFHIDPHLPVEKALITHAHSDHARSGHASVLASKETCDIMKIRLGADAAGSFQHANPGEKLAINGVNVIPTTSAPIEKYLRIRASSLLQGKSAATREDESAQLFGRVPQGMRLLIARNLGVMLN